MPTYSTQFYQSQDPARANTARLGTPNVGSGDVEFAVIPYTLIGPTLGEVAGDILNLGLLPVGCIPLPALSKVTCSADPGTGLVIDVGTPVDPDGWMDGITLSNGGQVEATSGTMPLWIAQTPLTAELGNNTGNVLVFATVVSASALVAGVVLHFTLAYKRNKG
jgi:hypothetical protein